MRGQGGCVGSHLRGSQRRQKLQSVWAVRARARRHTEGEQTKNNHGLLRLRLRLRLRRRRRCLRWAQAMHFVVEEAPMCGQTAVCAPTAFPLPSIINSKTFNVEIFCILYERLCRYKIIRFFHSFLWTTAACTQPRSFPPPLWRRHCGRRLWPACPAPLPPLCQSR